MSLPVDAISAIDAGLSAAPASLTQSGFPTQNFADVLEQSVGQVDAKINQADLEVRKLAVGEEGDLHRVMISLEDAKMSLSLMIQVRNRVVESYQELMRMQI